MDLQFDLPFEYSRVRTNKTKFRRCNVQRYQSIGDKVEDPSEKTSKSQQTTSFWTTWKWWIIAGVLTLLSISFVVFGLVYDFGEDPTTGSPTALPTTTPTYSPTMRIFHGFNTEIVDGKYRFTGVTKTGILSDKPPPVEGFDNPTIILYRGDVFFIDLAVSEPYAMTITDEQGQQYDEGIINNGIHIGQIQIHVDEQTPDTLRYRSKDHETAGGLIRVKYPPTPTPTESPTSKPTHQPIEQGETHPPTTASPTSSPTAPPSQHPDALDYGCGFAYDIEGTYDETCPYSQVECYDGEPLDTSISKLVTYCHTDDTSVGKFLDFEIELSENNAKYNIPPEDIENCARLATAYSDKSRVFVVEQLYYDDKYNNKCKILECDNAQHRRSETTLDEIYSFVIYHREDDCFPIETNAPTTAQPTEEPTELLPDESETLAPTVSQTDYPTKQPTLPPITIKTSGLCVYDKELEVFNCNFSESRRLQGFNVFSFDNNEGDTDTSQLVRGIEYDLTLRDSDGVDHNIIVITSNDQAQDASALAYDNSGGEVSPTNDGSVTEIKFTPNDSTPLNLFLASTTERKFRVPIILFDPPTAYPTTSPTYVEPEAFTGTVYDDFSPSAASDAQINLKEQYPNVLFDQSTVTKTHETFERFQPVCKQECLEYPRFCTAYEVYYNRGAKVIWCFIFTTNNPKRERTGNSIYYRTAADDRSQSWKASKKYKQSYMETRKGLPGARPTSSPTILTQQPTTSPTAIGYAYVDGNAPDNPSGGSNPFTFVQRDGSKEIYINLKEHIEDGKLHPIMQDTYQQAEQSWLNMLYYCERQCDDLTLYPYNNEYYDCNAYQLAIRKDDDGVQFDRLLCYLFPTNNPKRQNDGINRRRIGETEFIFKGQDDVKTVDEEINALTREFTALRIKTGVHGYPTKPPTQSPVSPSASPTTPQPTMSPTTPQPTQLPSPKPTKSPLAQGLTHEPTTSPVPLPTTSPSPAPTNSPTMLTILEGLTDDFVFGESYYDEYFFHNGETLPTSLNDGNEFYVNSDQADIRKYFLNWYGQCKQLCLDDAPNCKAIEFAFNRNDFAKCLRYNTETPARTYVTSSGKWVYLDSYIDPPNFKSSSNTENQSVMTIFSYHAAPTGSPVASASTSSPSTTPTSAPTSSPTSAPTGSPSVSPTGSPTTPTTSPTAPTTSPTAPTTSPTAPTASPTAPTASPTGTPSVSSPAAPTTSPTTPPV